MKKDQQNSPPAVRLQYEKGDQIMKEGDFGVSVYKIISGSVQVFTQTEEQEIILCLLGKDEIFGALTCFTTGISPRPCSARAIEKVELEAWHFNSLAKEYEEMPYIFKHITHELLNRCIRMNKLIRQMAPVEQETTSTKMEKTRSSERLNCRRAVQLACAYRPVDSSPKTRLDGRIRDISRGGANMEVKRIHTANFSHDIGEEFYLDITMPNGKVIHLTSRILAMREPKAPKMLSFGMIFTDMREDSRKELGLFMMS